MGRVGCPGLKNNPWHSAWQVAIADTSKQTEATTAIYTLSLKRIDVLSQNSYIDAHQLTCVQRMSYRTYTRTIIGLCTLLYMHHYACICITTHACGRALAMQISHAA